MKDFPEDDMVVGKIEQLTQDERIFGKDERCYSPDDVNKIRQKNLETARFEYLKMIIDDMFETMNKMYLLMCRMADPKTLRAAEDHWNAITSTGEDNVSKETEETRDES